MAKVKTVCDYCGREFEHERYSHRRYCSRICANKANARTGEQSSNWNNGVYMSGDGRKRIKVADKYEAEYRLIMEEHLGRKLTPKEVIHHIDGDKCNNEISNLQIMTRSEHATIHQLKPRVKTNCLLCDKEMMLDPKQIKNGKKFCSKICANRYTAQQHKEKGVKVGPPRAELTVSNCPICGKQVAFRPCDLRKGAKYCSVECYRISQRKRVRNG